MSMSNAYLDTLRESIKAGQKASHGAAAVAGAYYSSTRHGFDVIIWSDVMWEDDVEDIVKTLRAAGINELYITSQASNMLGIYLMLDELGMKLRGVVRLENPEYEQDVEKWGYSYEAPTIPAMKLSFEDKGVTTV